MDPQGLAELLADRQHRVERRHRILEHDPDLLPAHRAELGAAEAQEVAAREQRVAVRRAPGGRSPSSASTDIVFPLPLSPATPNTSAGWTA
jgi:hypothetical protein